ncbi:MULTISPECIES: CoxG family protein [unclassified Ruegeria]|uniref:CoxG family protein n=1 Tax=unclassified Ruegeria TaxID=2625375 RepID=UPI0014877BEB|nr:MULTISPECIES: carbon monoxide dehydrogenase subunit G [unclassified Ruegeria]NOD36113.1 carbon monoxide dehydrogenase [Ruegeria sp. HKCCD7296]NOE43506.1 carbon monoxide dehydrogenase [Ruegeria sp. HKCCD7319]
MELNDEIRISAPRDVVYRALNDPDVLRECIPGCEELIQHSPEHLEAKVVLKIGPVKARFNGEVTLDNSEAPDAFSLSGEGKGGAAGFANGGADVSLVADGEETVLSYTAKVAIGGKIAQLGSRLISGTAKKLSVKFFDRFGEVVADQYVG